MFNHLGIEFDSLPIRATVQRIVREGGISVLMLASIEMARMSPETAVGSLCHDGAGFKGQEYMSLNLVLPDTQDLSKRNSCNLGFIPMADKTSATMVAAFKESFDTLQAAVGLEPGRIGRDHSMVSFSDDDLSDLPACTQARAANIRSQTQTHV